MVLAIAHSSLGRTLRKLNTCLHNILSSFLSCGQKDAQVDYAYLTSVSDISRQEALEALSQLSHRMSRSALSLHQVKARERYEQGYSGRERARNRLHAKSESNIKDRARQSKPQDNKRPVVRKVQLSNASEPQLAMVRPKAQRSSSSKSDVSTNPPLPSPPPAYSSAPPSPGVQTPSNPLCTSPYRPTALLIPTPPPPASASPGYLSEPPMRRRQDKMTPSLYTFRSDSTKLGEIPMRRWNIPYDYDAMARLNQEAAGKPWPSHSTQPPKQKKGLFRLFKKTAPVTA